MSPLPVRMVLKKEVVLNSVAEFLGCWAVGGKATLSLNTQDGVTTITFSNTLSGHPEDPLHPPPSTQHRRCRHRGYVACSGKFRTQLQIVQLVR